MDNPTNETNALKEYEKLTKEEQKDFWTGLLLILAIGEQIDEKELKNTGCYKQLYEEYQELLNKEI